MNPRVKEVVPNNDYTINIVFDNGEEKVFDVKPFLDKGIFKDVVDHYLAGVPVYKREVHCIRIKRSHLRFDLNDLLNTLLGCLPHPYCRA